MIVKKIISTITLSFIFGNCPEGYQEYYNECYHSSDIDFLNTLMQNNCVDYDENNQYTIVECVFIPNEIIEDGIVYPNEICHQTWEEGRLVELNCENTGLIGNIPENIGNLNALWHLNMGDNNFVGNIT